MAAWGYWQREGWIAKRCEETFVGDEYLFVLLS